MKRGILLLLILALTVTAFSGCGPFAAAVIGGGRQDALTEIMLSDAFLNAVEKFDWQDPQAVRDLFGTWEETLFTPPDGPSYHAYVYKTETAFCEIDVCTGRTDKTGAHSHGNMLYDTYFYQLLCSYTFNFENAAVYVTEYVADGEELIFESLLSQYAGIMR